MPRAAGEKAAGRTVGKRVHDRPRDRGDSTSPSPRPAKKVKRSTEPDNIADHEPAAKPRTYLPIAPGWSTRGRSPPVDSPQRYPAHQQLLDREKERKQRKRQQKQRQQQEQGRSAKLNSQSIVPQPQVNVQTPAAPYAGIPISYSPPQQYVHRQQGMGPQQPHPQAGAIYPPPQQTGMLGRFPMDTYPAMQPPLLQPPAPVVQTQTEIRPEQQVPPPYLQHPASQQDSTASEIPVAAYVATEPWQDQVFWFGTSEMEMPFIGLDQHARTAALSPA